MIRAPATRTALGIVLTGALAWAACASRGDAPPQATQAQAPVNPTTALRPGTGLPPLVERHGELAIVLAKELKRAKSCDDIADVLERFVQRHRGELGPATAAVIEWERSAPADEIKGYYRNVFPAIEVRIDAGERCEKHAAARLAFGRYFTATGLE